MNRAPTSLPQPRSSVGMQETMRVRWSAFGTPPVWRDVLAVALIVGAALPMRLANIGSYSGKADEGIRAEQLLLMAAGFRPVRDIFASQGPLSLDVFYPFFVLMGETLAGARLAAVVYSVLGLVAVYWLARLAGGQLAGWTAGALLLLSPTYLKNSRLALVEIPALLPATLAIGAALAYQRGGRLLWLITSAAALALALAIKPMMLPAVPAVALAVALRRGPRLRDFFVYAAIVVAVLVVVVVGAGAHELYDQVVRYRLGSREAEGWSLAENWAMLWGELRLDQPALYVLSAVAGVVVTLACPRLGLPLVAWAIATFGLLLFYSPLGTKHAVLQLPPTAALAGAGLGWSWRLLSAGRAVPWKLVAVACFVVLLGYLWTLPAVLAQDRQAMSEGDLGPEPPYREETALIHALTGPTEYILVDDPYLAFLTRRLMPPQLVDTSIFRIRSGSLAGADVVAEAERFDVRLMLLLTDNLRELRRFGEWADSKFVVVKISERPNRKDRGLYLRADADLATARDVLRGLVPNAHVIEADLDSQLRMRGFAIERADLRAGGSTNLTVEWEAIAPMAADWHPITFLRDRDGRLVNQAERSLGGGSGGTSTWRPGHWVFRTSSLTIPPRTAPGDYTLSMGLYDSRARRMASVTGGSDAGREEVSLTSIRVR